MNELSGKAIVALHGKIQQARKKYGIDDFQELLAVMKEKGELSENQELPHKKLFSTYGYTLEDLRLLPDVDFKDALEEMTEEEMTEVFHYLGSTTEKEEIIKDEKMKQQKKEPMLKFNMPGADELEAEQQELPSVPRGSILTGKPDRPMLKFKGMKKEMKKVDTENRKVLKKQMWLKARQDFIDQHGAIDDETEVEKEVLSWDNYVENDSI